MNKIKLTYAAYMNSSGFSIAAQNYILALNSTNNFDIKIRVFGEKIKKSAISDENYELFMKMVKKEDDPERILIYHCIPNIQKRIKKYKKTIGFAVFETYSPPEKWVEILNKNDAIIVPSQFNYKIFSHMGIKKPIYYIPHCLDMNVYNKKVNKLKEYDKFTFLFLGTWKERKGYKVLVEAFLKEFNENENVQLLIKTDKPQYAEQYINSIKKQIGINKGFAAINFENRVFDEKDLPKFIKSADCLVSPSLGEGFGIPGLQSMALGVPVIITDFAGCQDYANENTAFLLKSNGFIMKSNMDNIPQFKNKKWAFIEVSKIRKYMRYVFEHYDMAILKSNCANYYVKDKFSYAQIGKLFTTALKEIYD